MVRSPSFQPAADEGVAGQLFGYFKVGDGYLADVVGAAAAAPAIAAIAHQIGADRLGLYISWHQCQIAANDGMRLELTPQAPFGVNRAGKYQQAASFLVESMHDAQARRGPLPLRPACCPV